MGQYFTERGRERREMYLLFILLVSPAFGRPSSDQPDVGAEISDQLNNILQFNNVTGNIFHNSSLTKEVIKMLLEAEQNILKMNAELKTWQTTEVKFKDNYFPLFNQAKSYLKQTRQDLRKLADRTVTDVRDMKVMLEALDEIKDSSAAIHFLKISMNRMKDLMVETLETLKKAKGKYNSAAETFDNLNLIIRKQNMQLKEFVTNSSDWIDNTKANLTYQITKSTVRAFLTDLLRGYGVYTIISAINSSSQYYATEREIAIVIEQIARVEPISDEMLLSGHNFDKALNVAINLLENEIEIVGKRTQSVKTIDDDEYPVELLNFYMLKPMRTIFIAGLDNLKKAAEEFLAQPKNILTLED